MLFVVLIVVNPLSVFFVVFWDSKVFKDAVDVCAVVTCDDRDAFDFDDYFCGFLMVVCGAGEWEFVCVRLVALWGFVGGGGGVVCEFVDCLV